MPWSVTLSPLAPLSRIVHHAVALPVNPVPDKAREEERSTGQQADR